jgi:hypothetical protein
MGKKIYYLFAAFGMFFVSSLHSLDAASSKQVRTSVDINSEIVVWGGPGFYYGVWFNNEDEYSQWQYNQTIWGGPGFYFGIWFGDERGHGRWCHDHYRGHGGHHHRGHHDGRRGGRHGGGHR